MIDAAGKVARWEYLGIKMPFKSDSELRMVVTSKGKTIGQCTITKDELLDAEWSSQNQVVSSVFGVFMFIL